MSQGRGGGTLVPRAKIATDTHTHTHTHTSADPPIPWAVYPVDDLRLKLFVSSLSSLGSHVLFRFLSASFALSRSLSLFLGLFRSLSLFLALSLSLALSRFRSLSLDSQPLSDRQLLKPDRTEGSWIGAQWKTFGEHGVPELASSSRLLFGSLAFGFLNTVCSADSLSSLSHRLQRLAFSMTFSLMATSAAAQCRLLRRLCI